MITPFRATTHDGRIPDRLHRHRRRTAPPTVFSGTIFRLRPRVEVMEDRTLLSTFLVSNTGDSGPGSLRQAIIDSNAAIGTTNTIDFAIPGSGVQTIAPLSSLPTITSPVLIDGLSQPSYSGTPLIELSGGQAGFADGLTITGPNVTIRGLDTNSFVQEAGIEITGTSASDRRTGSAATSLVPTRAEPRPSPTATASKSTRGPQTTLSEPTTAASTACPSGT